MITTAIINLGYFLISGIIGALPTSSGFSPDVISAAHTVGGYFGMFSSLVPMTTLATAVALVFSVEIAIFGWKTLKSIVSHLPQIGGSGH